MLNVPADGWAFLRLLRPNVGIHCLTIFLCDWAYIEEFSLTLITIVTLKATILNFIAKALTQVTVSVLTYSCTWTDLALFLVFKFSGTYAPRVAEFLPPWILMYWCTSPSPTQAAGRVRSNLVFGTGRIILRNRNPNILQFSPSPQTRLNRFDTQKRAMQSSFSYCFHSYLPGKEQSRV